MSDLRKRFEKETGKTVGEIGIYECDNCGNDQLEIETWNDNYVFWLENLANGVDKSTDLALHKHIVMPRISYFIDENGNNVDLNAEGVNAKLKKDGTFEYYRSFGFAGRKELTPVYGA